MKTALVKFALCRWFFRCFRRLLIARVWPFAVSCACSLVFSRTKTLPQRCHHLSTPVTQAVGMTTNPFGGSHWGRDEKLETYARNKARTSHAELWKSGGSYQCEQNTLTHHIFSCFTAHISMSHVTLAQVSCAHVIHVSSAWCCCFDTLRPSIFIFIFILHVGWFDEKSHAHIREWGARHFGREQSSHRLWAQPHRQLTDLRDHWNLHQELSSESRPSNLHELEIDGHTIGRALCSPLFTQEREDLASRGRAYHSHDECLLSTQSLSVGHVTTGRHVFDEFGSLISNVRENPCRDSGNEQIRILLERQEEQTLADYRAQIQKHEFQADSDRRSIQKVNVIIESQRREIDHALAGDEQLRQDQQLLHEQLLEQNREIREAHEKSLNEMEELKRFQGSTLDTIARRKLVEDRDTILELTGKIQELQNEINYMNDSRDFQDAESVRSGPSHVTGQPVFFTPHPDPGGMLSRSLGMPSRNNGPPSIWDTHGMSGNVFANPTASSSAPYPQESNPWSSNVSEQTSPHMMSESQTPALDQRCQSGPSARNSVLPSEGGSSKNYGADQQRLQNSDPRFDKSPRQQRLLVWR